MSKFSSQAKELLTSLNQQLTDNFQEQATSMGWNPELAASMRVDTHSMTVSFSSSKPWDQAEDAEYGHMTETTSSPPIPVMRNFEPNAQKVIGKSLVGLIDSTLKDLGPGFFA